MLMDRWQPTVHIQIDGLLLALKSNQAAYRRRAAAALHVLNIEAAIPALQAAYQAETDPTTRETVSAALSAYGVVVEPAPPASKPSKDTIDLLQTMEIENAALGNAKPANRDNIKALLSQERVPATPRAGSSAQADGATPTNDLAQNTEAAHPATANAPVPSARAVDELIKKLNDESPEVVIEAAEKLGDLGNRIAVEPLILLFNNQRHSIQVRLAVAEALIKLESAPVEVALLANLRHADWHIRRNGAAILGQLRAEWAIPPLAKALHDPHPIVRRMARAALRNIGTPESRRALATIGGERSETMEPQNPTGTRIKRISEQERRDPAQTSRMLQHLESSSDGDAPETAPPDETSPARRGTEPLDPDVLQAIARRDRPQNSEDGRTSKTTPLSADVVKRLEREMARDTRKTKPESGADDDT